MTKTSGTTFLLIMTRALNLMNLWLKPMYKYLTKFMIIIGKDEIELYAIVLINTYVQTLNIYNIHRDSYINYNEINNNQINKQLKLNI